MKLEEAIEVVNTSNLYTIDEAEYIIDYDKKLVEGVDLDNYRRFAIAANYYQLEDGILGIRGIYVLYPTDEDTEPSGVKSRAFEGESYIRISYREKITK